MRENRKDGKQNLEEIQEARNSLGWKIYIFLNLNPFQQENLSE